MPRLRVALVILAVAGLAIPYPAAAYCPHLTVGVRVLTGAGAAGIATADFDGDGKMDVAVVSTGANNVRVYRGDGTGGDGTGVVGFTGGTDYSVGTSPVALAAGDFNLDGKPDLVVANSTNTFSILINNGSGFAAANTSSAGSGPRAVAVGDMNRDGKLDFVIANYSGNNLRIHFGNGDGTFGSTDFAAGTHPTGVAVADFNNDGAPDMAVTDEGSNNVGIFLGSTLAGFFYPAVFYPTGALPADIVAGHFNPDPYIDLAVVTSENTEVLTNNGSGVFATGLTTSYAGVHIVAGDFNGDSFNDLAVSGSIELIIIEMNANGDEIFDELSFVGTAQGGLAVADMNSDGRLDLIDSEPALNRITLQKNTGRCFANCGSFASAGGFATGSSPFGIAVGNFNGDRTPDVAIPSNASNNVSVLLGNNSPGFDAPANYPTAQGSFAAAAGDLNRDGHDDIVVVNTVANSITILRASFGTFVPTNYPAGFAPYSVAIADFNGDAYADLAIANPNANAVSVWLQAANGSFTATSQTVGSVPFFATVGDFNRDGRMDIASANTAGGDVSIRLGNGDGTFGAAVSYTAGTEPRFLVVADFNHDAKPDIAVANSTSNNISILLGTGAGAFAAPVNYDVGPRPVFLATGDFDLDGNTDIVSANMLGGTISVLMSSANGTFTVRPEISAGSNTVAVAVADFDRDGKPDIVAVTEGSNSVALRLNKCLFPELRVEKSHVGSFTQGQTGAEYAIIVYNVGNAPSTGTITVSDLLPAGLIATGFAGVTPGWTCNIQTLTCTTAGAIPANGSSPQITLTVNVRSNAASTETNTATLSGGGDTDPDNNRWANDTIVNEASLIGPTDLVATASSIGQVNLTWDAVTGANGYGVFKTWNGGTGEFFAPSPNFTDTAVVANTTYIYQVAAVTLNNTVSDGSNKDIATTFFFTDDPLIPGTKVKAIHFLELRSAVDMVRAAAGLGPAAYRNVTIGPGSPISLIDLIDVRRFLGDALTLIGVPPALYTFTDPMPPPNTLPVKALHIFQLRSAIK